VRVERLLLDRPALPPDGTYTRWRTFLCTVSSGTAAPGGGEGANAELVDIAWLPIRDEGDWPDDVRSDVFLYPQLRDIRLVLVVSASDAEATSTTPPRVDPVASIKNQE
jgi:hypothetical protein